MRSHTVLADTEHDRALLPELRIQLTKPAGLLRAARRHVLRVKIQNHLLSPVIREAVHLSVLVRQGEIRCFCSNCQHLTFLLLQ